MQILESGFRPNFIVGVWRGGTPVGIAVQELLDYFDVKTNHIAIRTSYYTGIDETDRQVRVHGLGYVVDQINYDDHLLIVDDVYDSGMSIEAVIRHLERHCRRNLPADIRVATVYFKPARNRTDRAPDYYIHEVDEWLVFPHELHGLTADEIAQHKSDSAPVVELLRKIEREKRQDDVGHGPPLDPPEHLART